MFSWSHSCNHLFGSVTLVLWALQTLDSRTERTSLFNFKLSWRSRVFKPRSVSLSVLQLRSVQREPCCRTVQEGECAADELVGQTLALTLSVRVRARASVRVRVWGCFRGIVVSECTANHYSCYECVTFCSYFIDYCSWYTNGIFSVSIKEIIYLNE